MSRPSCERCYRPLPLCVCNVIAPVQSRTRVLVLQHPQEARHPLNTGRLAVLGLRCAGLLVGEVFPTLEKAIAEASPVFLLFPGEGAMPPAPLSLQDPPVLAGAMPSPLLIVPDGTWRKARKIVQANPVLQGLPRLCLVDGAPSRYRVRKTTEPGAVATIEAIVRTLSALEPERDFKPVLAPFERLIEQQIKAMGPDIYVRHHDQA